MKEAALNAFTTVALAGLLLAGLASPCLAWGTAGHIWIVNEALQLLPDTEAQYMKKYYRRYIYYHVMEPDLRKEQDENEGPKHFFDLEDYVRSGLRVQDWPWDRAAARQRVGEANYADYGQGPWELAETKEQLLAALRARNWMQARVLFADLSHYVGDLNQPLHCTKNFNGQITGNRGVHMRFEKDLLQRYGRKVPPASGTPRLISDPLRFNFAMIKASNARVSAVMIADGNAAWEPGLYDRTYYEKFWLEAQPVLTESLHAGALALASYYLTVIVEARQSGALAALDSDPGALHEGQDTEVAYEPQDADRDRGYSGRQRGRYNRDRRESPAPDPPSPEEQATRLYLIAGGLFIGLGGIGGMAYAAHRRRKKSDGQTPDDRGGHDIFGGD